MATYIEFLDGRVPGPEEELSAREEESRQGTAVDPQGSVGGSHRRLAQGCLFYSFNFRAAYA